jgi:hypothetical protein
VSDYIDNILPMPKGVQLPQCSRPKLLFTIDGWDQQVYQSLPQWIQTKIATSPEGKAKISGQPAPTAGQAGSVQQHDDDIPF